VIVDFYADWYNIILILRCGPCKVLKPKLHDLADKNEGKWTLAVLNVDIEELGSIS
jgi:thioredoxin 1